MAGLLKSSRLSGFGPIGCQHGTLSLGAEHGPGSGGTGARPGFRVQGSGFRVHPIPGRAIRSSGTSRIWFRFSVSVSVSVSVKIQGFVFRFRFRFRVSVSVSVSVSVEG